ncbi:hypothetical protein ACXJY6_02575 [Vibrio sp. RC27]
MRVNFKTLDYRLDVIKSCVLLVLMIFLTACVSKPRQVVAETQLVVGENRYQSMDEVPSDYWEALNLTSSESLDHVNYHIKLGPIYTSALGSECRVAVISRKQTFIFGDYRSQTRVFCSTLRVDDDETIKTWYLVKSLRDTAPDIEL